MKLATGDCQSEFTFFLLTFLSKPFGLKTIWAPQTTVLAMGQPLTEQGSANEAKIGYHADGQQTGLYLQVRQGKTGLVRSWVYRYRSRTKGKRRDLGLGPLADVSLADARIKAAAARAMVLQGIDPIEARRQNFNANGSQAADRMTFKEAAAGCLEARKARWSSPRQSAQWESTLATYLLPALGHKFVDDITAYDLRDALAPIWTSKPATASRVRQRAEAIMEWTIALKLHPGPNPDTYRGNLAHLLPSQVQPRPRKDQGRNGVQP